MIRSRFLLTWYAPSPYAAHGTGSSRYISCAIKQFTLHWTLRITEIHPLVYYSHLRTTVESRFFDTPRGTKSGVKCVRLWFEWPGSSKIIRVLEIRVPLQIISKINELESMQAQPGIKVKILGFMWLVRQPSHQNFHVKDNNAIL